MGKMIIIPSLLQVLALAGCGLFDGEPSVQLRAVPASAVEMTLEIRAPAGRELTLSRDGIPIAAFTPSTRDTFYIDSGLSPATAYTWQVRGGMETARARAATTDTTSSNFTWQTFTFGGTAGSSVLHDVAIIDENNIWAVGEIYVRDEEHINGYQMYNAVHWDGVEWELKQVPFTGSCSAVIYPPIRALWAYGSNDIWFARGGSLVHFDGGNYTNDCQMHNLLTGSINKIWGASSGNLYIAGDNGALAHYNGVTWRKIESGTQLHFRDIWGSRHSGTGKWQVLAVTSNLFSPPTGRILMEISGTSVRHLPTGTFPHAMSSVYFVPGRKYWAVGGGVHESPEVGTGAYWIAPGKVTSYYSRQVRGLGLNDVIVVGDYGEVVHFNGKSWTNVQDVPEPRHGYYLSVNLTQNMVVAVGGIDHAATISVGLRE